MLYASDVVAAAAEDSQRSRELAAPYITAAAAFRGLFPPAAKAPGASGEAGGGLRFEHDLSHIGDRTNKKDAADSTGTR